jgi:hypothetical protein
VSPSELRELARLIDGRYLALFTEHELDEWETAVDDWANDPAEERGDRPVLPATSGEHAHVLIVDALRQAADAAEIGAAIQRTARYRAELEAML